MLGSVRKGTLFQNASTPKSKVIMRELAGHIIDSKTTDFDPTKFEDRYEDAVIALFKSKETGEPIKAPSTPPSNVVNLMDALRLSIEAEKPVTAKRRHRRPEPSGPRADRPKGRAGPRKPVNPA